MAELSAYEKERLETIRTNHAKLVELGLERTAKECRNLAPAKKVAQATEKKVRVKRQAPASVPTRVSKRNKGEKPEYGKEKIDRFGEELDEKAERQTRTVITAEEKEAARAEAKEAAQLLLEEARAKIRRERKGAAGGDQSGWRAEAIKRWGPRAGECETDDWEGFVASREATPAPTSPDPLLQEYYAKEPWKLLVACALMTRVSSHDTKARCIEGFFALCPTPSAFLDADATDVEEVINSLGLFDNRYRQLVDITTKFLEMPLFAIGLDPELKIYGCGPFTVDSYHIFANDDRTIRPNDAALISYVRWRDGAFPRAKTVD